MRSGGTPPVRRCARASNVLYVSLSVMAIAPGPAPTSRTQDTFTIALMYVFP